MAWGQKQTRPYTDGGLVLNAGTFFEVAMAGVNLGWAGQGDGAMK